MKILAIAVLVYVVGAVVHLVSFLVLVEAKQKLKLDPPAHFGYRPGVRGGVIETHGTDEMAVFGGLFTSLLSWLGVIFLVIPGTVWTVQEVIRRKRQATKQE